MAGIGNVYCNELCFVSGHLPTAPVSAVTDPHRLVARARDMLWVNRFRQNRCTTGDTRAGRQLWVYGRADRVAVAAARRSSTTTAASGLRTGARPANAECPGHVYSVNDQVGRAGRSARFKSPGAACNDRNVSGLACCRNSRDFCSADRMRKDDHPSALDQSCAITSDRPDPCSVVTLSFGVMGVTAAGANADAVDSSFLNALQSKQITFASGQAAVIAAHQVCDALDSGRDKNDVANDVMQQSSLDGYHAGFFVGVSIAAFCPRHTGA